MYRIFYKVVLCIVLLSSRLGQIQEVLKKINEVESHLMKVNNEIKVHKTDHKKIEPYLEIAETRGNI